MNDSQFNNRSRWNSRARRGVSLIEILVVLVILVTGILTIIRLFPSGFFSIQSTGNAALANSLGGAALNLEAQNAQGLPNAIVPDDLAMDNLASAVTNSATYSKYDPDDPNNLENARVVQNETITVPTAVQGQSVYVVNYGPVIMPGDPSTSNGVAALPSYFTVNSPYWTAQAGNSALSTVVSSAANVTSATTDIPQDTLTPGHEQFLVDLANKKIAVPYAAYTADGTTSTTSGTPSVTVQNASSYPQKMVALITCYDSSSKTSSTYTKYLDVPAGTPKNGSSPYAPFAANNQAYLPDANVPGGSGYQGGWFDPSTEYQDSPNGQTVPTGTNIQWVSVTLYRPYTGIANNANTMFSNDPYEFTLTAANIATAAANGNTPATGANPGAVGFNPKAATGSGALAHKALISYIVYSWGILREDHDIPALTGGSTFAVRTAVPNLLLAGSANPDNSINPGIAGSNDSMVIMNLDTGKIVAPSAVNPDPTNPDLPLNNEDLNGTSPGPSNNYINASYALGRLTFGSDAFGDNSKMDGTGTAPAHRIRIFYTADLNWAVAVQKAPAYFTEDVTSPAGMATGTTPLGATQFALNSGGSDPLVYFARCNAGKTVEIDGTYTLNGETKGFSDTIAVGQILNSLGDTNVSVDIADGTTVNQPVLPGATGVRITAVRGLSARSVVAWKERNLYKVHTVDAVLNRTP